MEWRIAKMGPMRARNTNVKILTDSTARLLKAKLLLKKTLFLCLKLFYLMEEKTVQMAQMNVLLR